MEYLESISTVLAIMTTVAMGYLGLRSWLQPIKITPGTSLAFNSEGVDKVTAQIVNTSSKPLFITECVAKGVVPRRAVLMAHLRQPFMPARFYKAIWYRGPQHQLLSGNAIKLDPMEPVDLEHKLSTRPIFGFLCPQLIVEVTLSNGRVIQSRRLRVPARWMFYERLDAHNAVSPAKR